MASKKSNKPTPRHRNWGMILYPDSVPDNWVEILNQYFVPWAYILHDKDTKIDENGEITVKKPHYHVLIKFSNQKSYRQMLNLKGKLKGLNPMPLESIKGYARDFLHLDNQDAHQYKYNISEVKSFHGLDFQDLIKPSKTEEAFIMREMRRIIRENEVTELCDLYHYFDKENYIYSSVIDKKTYAIGRYIDSVRHKPKLKPKNVTPRTKKVLPISSNMTPNIYSLKMDRQIEESKAFALSQLTEEDYFDLYEAPLLDYSY